MLDKDLLSLIIDETHYSQAQIAKFAGVSKQYINLVYKGKTSMSFACKEALKKHFPEYFSVISLPKELTPESIKQYRVANKYSQPKFAEMLGIYQYALSQIENGIKPISDEFKDNFYKVFSKIKDSQEIAIFNCPEVTIPNNFSLPKHPEVIKVNGRLFNVEKGLNVDFNQTYIVSVSGDNLEPEYKNNDRVLLDTSHRSFIDGYTYFISVNKHNYVTRVNVSPNKVKCIPFNKEQDAFYLDTNGYEIIGLIVPRIRL